MLSKYSSTPTLLALAAIALWSSLAVLGTLLSHIPPFLLTGIALQLPFLGDSFFAAKLVGSTGKGYFWGNTIGYVLAAVAAFICASYSLMGKRLNLAGQGLPTAAIGLFGLVSGALSLLCHALLEVPTQLSARDWLLMIVMGPGPLGAAFFLWDAALKNGDARNRYFERHHAAGIYRPADGGHRTGAMLGHWSGHNAHIGRGGAG